MSSIKPPGQLPLDLSTEPSVSREDLAQSPANAIAISMVDAWPNWPGYAVVLAGPVGSGKSHLANAWISMAGGITCKSDDISTRSEELQNVLRADGNLVIEDAGKGALDETALFHLLNLVRQEAKHCLITSRTWPSEWGIELPDLLSRLRAAQVIELQEPDDDLLKQVMFKLFADRQLSVDARIIDYCVLRMERSLGSAAKLVSVIDEIALARKATISRALAGEALERLGMN